MTKRQTLRVSTFATALMFLLGASSAFAAGNRPAWVMAGATAVPDSDLPVQAKHGSGLASDLNPAAFGASSLYFTLADGRVLEAHRQRMAENVAKGRESWIGTFDEEPGSFAILTKVRGVTTGFITYGAETFEIAPTRGGKHMLYEVDESKLPQGEPTLPTNGPAKDTSGTAVTGYGAGTAADTGGVVQDLLVVYTPASAARYGQAALESKIVAAVDAANQAYLNSGVNITLNLVGLQEINYTEPSSIDQALYDLQGTSDGKMDSVHTLRNQLGADIVSLVDENKDACGVGWVMQNVSTSFASSAFNVVYSACLSQHSLAHEIGHNQGNMHDRASSSYAGAYPYSYGYRRCVSDGTGFRTVMSYPCSGAPRVAQFSNPSVLYNGYATGISYELDPSNSADDARSMNNTAATVAAFRTSSTSSTTPTAPTPPAAPSSLSAGATSSSSISLAWTDNSSDESGFKVERSSDGVIFSEIATLGSNVTSYADTGLPAQTTYWYRVRAYNSAGDSSYSNTTSATTQAVAPAAPSSVAAADDGNGSATVSWTDGSADETGFEVMRETYDTRHKRWKSATTIGTVPTGIYSLVDQAGSGTYRYSVRAVNSGAASAYAGPAQVTVTGGSTSTSTGPKGGGKSGGGGGGKGRTK